MGLGFAALSSFCETLGMPQMQEKTFQLHIDAISSKSVAFKESMLASAIEKVRHHHGASDDEMLDLAVCFDGTWHKRGHTSKHGLAAVIEIETGLVIDYHVMTSYCQLCETIGAAKKKEGDLTYANWWAEHKEACKVNHIGSSGNMEVEAARVMWRRSMERQLRYTTMVSDGDCKTFTEIQKLQPYDIPVEKEECTNHVAKRLGTALRTLGYRLFPYIFVFFMV